MRRRLSFAYFLAFVFIFVLVFWLPLSSRTGIPSSTEKQSVAYTKEEFIREIAPTVQKAAASYGLRPSVILGQAVLASDYGRNLLAVKYHNLFGIAAQPGDDFIDLKTELYEDNVWQTRSKRFKIYRSWDEAIYDYLDLLKSGDLWGERVYVQMATLKGYKGPAQSLQGAGFSTDPDYALKLTQLIEENDLTQYD
ncbi:peptidoglycan hydrolase [Streptococcus chenjunshii]|uniref:Peptidoglycan hydrolase n=1 Tax=Streptococcus chenjunshii TaxID=2173853 RepID=A0A372KL85_9STRE|nr:glycoside hydrolase family 73 protein [Streptococcus chenjunshii]AXQ79323.1 peptidoglycan hydrolase [Streptococcus chenjunshii]RFU50903.1 peptidoglycan hydrolase [Streptococcus chenjunshii]RFU53049.1 peptidoglycan hydrolase [Streptococcus chenjunshii]